jgi:hypothetical protein
VAAENNSQIGAIISYKDVYAFFSKLFQIGQTGGRIKLMTKKHYRNYWNPPRTTLILSKHPRDGRLFC